MNSNWIIRLPNDKEEIVQCVSCGVTNDGSLLCFVNNPAGQPEVLKGYAPGQWHVFYRSTIRSN